MSLFPASPVLRIGLYMLLGALSAIGLLIAFAGAVAYLLIVIYPLLAIWLAFGLFVAVSAGTGRAARAYVYGNLGVLAATVIVFIVGIVVTTASYPRPSDPPRAAAFLYPTLAVIGLALGFARGWWGPVRHSARSRSDRR